MSSTPFLMVSRSESAESACGSQESVAMLAMTRGPSRKPACAATKSSAPSLSSAAITNHLPKAKLPMCQSPAMRSRRKALSVFSRVPSGSTPRPGCRLKSR